MFTGIIEARGTIVALSRSAQDLSLSIDVGALCMADVKLGDSIAVNGVCLTVVRLRGNSFDADVSSESLAHTMIEQFKVGQQVNLEKALTLATRLGGHVVSGHVDGVGEIVAMQQDGRSQRYEIKAPQDLHKYIAAKGSISVDGASLTVTALTDAGFCLNIVPHTMANTIMPNYSVGTKVHLEVDLIARYAERLLSFGNSAETESKSEASASLSREFLSRHGFGGRR